MLLMSCNILKVNTLQKNNEIHEDKLNHKNHKKSVSSKIIVH